MTESRVVHEKTMYFCIVNQTNKQNKKVMKRRIICVGTLVDLAELFEPDVDDEQEVSIELKQNFNIED